MSVTVVGSLNSDVVVTVDRLPGRGETVVGTAVTVVPGGKGANQAAAAGRLGTDVHMVGRVGDDDAAGRQLAALAESRVNVSRVQRTPGTPTGTATIPVEADGGENLIVVVPGANAALTPADVDVESVHRAGVLLLQLETPLETVRAAAAATRGTVVLNPAPARELPAGLLAAVDVLVPNEHELVTLCGAAARSREPAELVELARSLGVGTVVVTLGPAGALAVLPDGTALLQPPLPVEPVDTTGAGDCFCGALCTALARGDGLAEAVGYATAAAALSTTGAGARGGLPDDDAVRTALRRLPPARPLENGSPPGPRGTAQRMTETTPHPEDPAEGTDTGTDPSSGRTPRPEEPAEGADDESARSGEGVDTAPEGTVDADAPGIDPTTRITGA